MDARVGADSAAEARAVPASGTTSPQRRAVKSKPLAGDSFFNGDIFSLPRAGNDL